MNVRIAAALIGLLSIVSARAEEPAAVVPASGTPSPAAPKAADAPAKPMKAMDHLDLDATQITGNRELPKVMVIVPWKHADVSEVAGRPANSLMDEVLKPVDRDVARRELEFFKKTGQPQAGATAKPEN